VEFSGGLAHKGMAKRADDLLNSVNTTNAIANGLDQNQGYQLILTGHSLGAGIAALLAIKLHADASCRAAYKADDHDIRCFGFGCPPVFAPTENTTHLAFANTFCFINGKDVIPFLSIDAIRRLVAMLKQVNDITKTLNPLDQVLMLRGMKEPPGILVRNVMSGSANLEPLPGAERLEVPGEFVMWMDDALDIKPKASASDVVLCQPSKISNLAIRLADDFIVDHLPPRYEERFIALKADIREPVS
jgi:Lipase (class 3)